MQFSEGAFRMKLELELASVPEYQLGVLIGKGELGLVFSAMEAHSQMQVALKAVETARLNPNQERRVQREIEILRRVNHPNLMYLLEALR
jgi:serine/threonine-protein kinase ULK2